jgi:hypothetical protein
MHSIIPDRVLAFPSLLFAYLPTTRKHDIDVTHVFDLLSSDLESVSPLHSPLSLRHRVSLHLSGATNIAYITNQTLLYKYISLSHAALADRVIASGRSCNCLLD